MALSRRFTTETATQGPQSLLRKWLLLILGISLLPAKVAGGVRMLGADHRPQTTAARTILQAPDQPTVGEGSLRGHVQVVDPPGGSYTLATSQQLFKDALTTTDPEKRIRLPPNTILQLCEGQTITRGSHVIVDCQDSTFDLRCSEWFHLDSGSHVELFRCHVLWPPAQDFSSLQIGTQLLRVEEDAILDMHGGSFTIWCEELLDMPGAAALSQLSPGDSATISNWSTTFVNPAGVLDLQHVTLYCTSKDIVFDTPAEAFSEALGRAEIGNSANQTIQLTGLLTLEPPSVWHLRREALPGQTVITGMSPFTTIDFRGSKDIFELQAPAYGDTKGQRSLLLRDLTLANLPFMEASQGNIEKEFLSAMLWIAVAGEGPTREELPLYHLQNVQAAVSCPEVAFLRDFFSRLRSNAVNHDNYHIDFKVLDARRALLVTEMLMLGIRATNYTISCETLPRVPRLPAVSADVLASTNANKLADSCIPPPPMRPHSQGALGEETGLKIAAICAAAFVVMAGVCCMWWGCCDCCCSEPPSVEQYIGSLSMHSDTICTDSSAHAFPTEFDSLSNRFTNAAAKGIIGTEQAPMYITPQPPPHFSKRVPLLLHSAGPHALPQPAVAAISDHGIDSSSPTVPGASMLSCSTLDICKTGSPSPRSAGTTQSVGSLPSREPCITHRSSSADDNSVICASEPRADDLVAAVAHRSTSSSSSDIARRTLEQTRHDVENEHLEIEGIIGDSGHGTVYWGTWRGLEVAIKTVAFQVPTAEASRVHNQAREEADVVYNLSHANIVNTLSHELKRFNDIDATAASHFKLYMIQEYCAGGTLSNLVRHGHLLNKEGGVRFERALMLLRDVAAGLAYVHSQNIVHGNLNPENVLLQVPPSERAEEHHEVLNDDHAALLAARALDSEQCTAKISDFGLSVQYQEAMWLQFHERPGAELYAAPELQQNSRRTRESDAYAFGVIMWEVFMSRPPFTYTESGVEQDASFPGFPAVCPFNYAVLSMACMASNSDDRPPIYQAYEVLTSLEVELAAGTFYDWTGTQRDVSELVSVPVATKSIRMPDSKLAGPSDDLPSPAEGSTAPACGAGSSVGTISGVSKSSENTSSASVSFYTSVDAASRGVGAGTNVGRAVSHALAQLGHEDSVLQDASNVLV